MQSSEGQEKLLRHLFLLKGLVESYLPINSIHDDNLSPAHQ